MNKTELVAAVAAKLDCTQKAAELALTTVLETIVEGVKADSQVAVRGFGSFKLKVSKAREGRNPSNGAVIQIPAKTSVGFKSQITL
jgi:nucleoid DNA-binding protein